MFTKLPLFITLLVATTVVHAQGRRPDNPTPPTSTTSTTPMVVTEAGKVVGRYASTADDEYVIIDHNGTPVSLEIDHQDRSYFVWPGQSGISFTTTDCSGPIYLRQGIFYTKITKIFGVPMYTPSSPSVQVGVIATTSSPQMINVGSTWTHVQGCNPPSSTDPVPAFSTTIIPLDSPPFYVQ
jgi:hypothetical protein